MKYVSIFVNCQLSPRTSTSNKSNQSADFSFCFFAHASFLALNCEFAMIGFEPTGATEFLITFMYPFVRNWKIFRIENYKLYCKLIYGNLSLPHLEPVRTGHAACRVLKSPSPDLCKLYQKAADPFLGRKAMRRFVKTVAPPCSTSLICKVWNIRREYGINVKLCPSLEPIRKQFFRLWVN